MIPNAIGKWGWSFPGADANRHADGIGRCLPGLTRTVSQFFGDWLFAKTAFRRVIVRAKEVLIMLIEGAKSGILSVATVAPPHRDMETIIVADQATCRCLPKDKAPK